MASDREKIEKAAYLRRMYEEKLAHVNPKKSFKDRVNEAISDMDKKFGQQWRDMLEESGLDFMPSADSDKKSTKSGPKKEVIVEDLEDEADEEGIGRPPESFYSKEKEPKVVENDTIKERVEKSTNNQQPLVIIIEKRFGDVKRKRATTRAN